MIRRLQVLNSDHVNRYGMKFAVGALAMSVDQTWSSGIPSYIGHDMNRPIGWMHSLGLYFEPGATYHLGYFNMPQSQSEQESIVKAAQAFQNDFHHEHCNAHQNTFRTDLNGLFTGNEKYLYSDAVGVVDIGLATRLAKNIFESVDKKGLVSIPDLLNTTDALKPGVFQIKGSNWLLFAHPYFRRSQSRLNSFHMDFLNGLLSQAKRKDLDVRIALDNDMVGLASTLRDKIELAYWHGPIFNDDISAIPLGVSRYLASDRQKFFSNVSIMDIWWKEEGGRTHSGSRGNPRWALPCRRSGSLWLSLCSFDGQEWRKHTSPF